MMLAALPVATSMPASLELQEQETITVPSHLEKCKRALRDNKFYWKQMLGGAVVGLCAYLYWNNRQLQSELLELQARLERVRNGYYCSRDLYVELARALYNKLLDNGVSPEELLYLRSSVEGPIYVRYGFDPHKGYETLIKIATL